MKYSIRKKTAMYMAILMVLTFILGMALLAIFSRSYYVSITTSEMKNAHKVIKELSAEDSSGFFFREVPADCYSKLTDICEKNGFSMLVLRPDGFPTFTYGNANLLLSRLNELIFQSDEYTGGAVIDKGRDYVIQTVTDDQDNIQYLEMWGVLDYSYWFIYRCSYSGIRNNMRISLSFYVIICAVIMIAFSINLLIALRQFTIPLKHIARVTARVNAGIFDEDIEGKRKRNDEIGIIADNVIEMAHKLERTISELKTSNINLRNELRNKEKIEEARKKYMSDVSHELKTPIALISGYAEGLKEGISASQEDRDYYCDVIIDEAEKMNLMIKKLSSLNQLEQGKSAVSMERFNVVEVIEGFLSTMSMIIEEKGLNVFFNNTDVAYVWSDEFLFEDVLVNYFNNAVNHINEKKIIRINVEKIDSNIRVTVFNTGDNIPEDELDNIWGKFYKVDKARTREYGGSGLGLSIVKAIAEQLDKECGVYNTPDGVAFYIELESAGDASIHSGADEKPEKHSRLKMSELPIWKGFRKKSKEDSNK
ncbi:MAG: HAMP domain-containing histidine kinase [Parasporobacterium sp.]|nr:HAMP domain-containing histidine kinase [Parasporobacterium sp.]